MFNKEMFSKFLGFLIDNEEELNKQGIVVDSWFLDFLFEFKGKAGRIAFTYDLINELESFKTCLITSEQVIIGKAENAIDLSYPFDEFPQLKKIIEPELNAFVDIDCYEGRSGEAVPLLFDLYMLQQRLEPLKKFDWDIYHHDLSPFGNLVYASDINDLEHLINEAEGFVDDYLSGKDEYFTDAPHEALYGDYDNWNLSDLRDLAETLGDSEFIAKVDELSTVVQLFHTISANYYNFNRISYEMYQDKLSNQRYKESVQIKPDDSAKEAKPKTYTVEILAAFELKLAHQFSDVDIQNSGGVITEAFDDLILEIEGSFSSDGIVVNFESAKRRRKDELYRLSGNIQRCYEFSEQDVDLDEGELIDGVFDTQLNDMKLAVEAVFEQSGYDLTLVSFNWVDDEIMDKE